MWNCRGFGNLRTEKELGVLVRAKDPSIMFLVETWSDEARLKDIKRKLEFDHVFVVPQENRGGGLALFWKIVLMSLWRLSLKITWTQL